jgi:anaerobic sulfite reductase subunit C
MFLHWDIDAEAKLKRIPFFMRKMVRNKVEERVRKNSGERVTVSDFQEAEARFKNVTADKSNDELSAMMPVDNQPGVDMVVVEVCHAKLSNCPNVIIDPEEWKVVIEDWVSKNDISERLREKAEGEKILFHHKFRVSISGCPNGCSRPQIADFALVGFVVPDVDSDKCTSCGLCMEACPDSAISFDSASDGDINDGPPIFDRVKCLGCYKCRDSCPTECINVSEGALRILIGGKLGRHPHLADNVGVIKDPEELEDLLTRITDDYLKNSKTNERFSDFWIQSGRSNYK